LNRYQGRGIDRSLNNLNDKLDRLWPEESGNGHNKNDGINYWKGKKILSKDIWRKLGGVTGSLKSLEYFPDQYISFFLTYRLSHSDDPIIRERFEAWHSQFLELMEYKKDPDYGKEKCARCLLSPDREEAAIFIGMNKVISRALDTDGESVYPCKVLNRFVCPYDTKIVVEGEDITRDKNQIEKTNIDYLFYLSELAFAVELALAKAQEKDSVFRIRSAADAYEALTNKEILEMVLQQGLKDEHKRYKDRIVELFMNMKDRIRVEDLTVYPC
jgi:hypothetical protein